MTRDCIAAIMDDDVLIMPGATVSRDEEIILFRQFNYARYQLSLLKEGISRVRSISNRRKTALLKWSHAQGRACSKIITCNMGLVLALGRRSGHLGVEFSELVSEGSMALLRATENFDCGRGFKFSTYAWRAITRAFLRLAKEHSRYYRLFSVQWDPMLEDENTTDWRQKLLSQERVAELRTIMSRNLADLSGVEQSVVAMRFPFDRGHKRPRTLSEVGHELGLSKERIRQIQVKALQKLRDVAEDRILRP